MNTEQHLFILWEHARFKEIEILKDIASNFEITNIFELSWNKKNFSNNLSRFYGLKLPKRSEKERHCGTGEFILVMVIDKNPCYGLRKTSRGSELVNTNLFDCKNKYREWTGGGHKVHATNNINETKHDLALLLGFTVEDYQKSDYYNELARIKKQQDLMGAYGWESLQQLFYVLNSTVEYLVLRNYEKLPYEYVVGEHGDVDILASNYREICLVLNAKEVYRRRYRVRNSVLVSGEEVYFDIRTVGDGYYDSRWQKEMLNKRIFNNFLFVPDPVNHFYSLLYHVLVHKMEIANDYYGKLDSLIAQAGIYLPNKDLRVSSIFKELIDKFLDENRYYYSDPHDLSVYMNPQIVDPNQISLRRKIFMCLVKLKKLIIEG